MLLPSEKSWETSRAGILSFCISAGFPIATICRAWSEMRSEALDAHTVAETLYEHRS